MDLGAFGILDGDDGVSASYHQRKDRCWLAKHRVFSLRNSKLVVAHRHYHYWCARSRGSAILFTSWTILWITSSITSWLRLLSWPRMSITIDALGRGDRPDYSRHGLYYGLSLSTTRWRGFFVVTEDEDNKDNSYSLLRSRHYQQQQHHEWQLVLRLIETLTTKLSLC